VKALTNTTIITNNQTTDDDDDGVFGIYEKLFLYFLYFGFSLCFCGLLAAWLMGFIQVNLIL
jgi:hypothetical protein